MRWWVGQTLFGRGNCRAHHEAGHAVARAAYGARINAIWIDRTGASGTKVLAPVSTTAVQTAVCCASGPVGEAIFLRTPAIDLTFGRAEVATDLRMATNILARMVRPPSLGEIVELADRLLRDRWHLVEAVAEAFVERGRIDGDQFTMLMGQDRQAVSSAAARR